MCRKGHPRPIGLQTHLSFKPAPAQLQVTPQIIIVPNDGTLSSKTALFLGAAALRTCAGAHRGGGARPGMSLRTLGPGCAPRLNGGRASLWTLGPGYAQRGGCTRILVTPRTALPGPATSPTAGQRPGLGSSARRVQHRLSPSPLGPPALGTPTPTRREDPLDTPRAAASETLPLLPGNP